MWPPRSTRTIKVCGQFGKVYFLLFAESKKRIDSARAQRGIGYGTGSTRSKWDIERAVEEQLAREEQLVWLLNALVSYLHEASPDFGDARRQLRRANDANEHVSERLTAMIADSVLITMLRDQMKNGAVGIVRGAEGFCRGTFGALSGH